MANSADPCDILAVGTLIKASAVHVVNALHAGKTSADIITNLLIFPGKIGHKKQ